MEYQKAIRGKNYMGLKNKICKNPRYWCRCHQVYLSEEDVQRKHCKAKPSFDMIGKERCHQLEELGGK